VITLITGITGMLGAHWAQFTCQKGWKTYGIARKIKSIPYLNNCEEIFSCDILDSKGYF